MAGGGIMAKGDCNVTLNNNTIVNNLAHLTGAGICTHGNGGAATFSGVNNIIVFNYADDGTQYGSTYGGGASTLTYSCILQDMPGIGNINDSPMFVNAAEDDYHLLYGSPCIDTGDPSSPPDPDGTRADMGALFFDQTGVGGAVAPSATFEMYPVSPNPFCSEARISCGLVHDGNVSVSIYDITGRKVITLCDQTETSGFHSWLWDGRNGAGQNVHQGIYFCVIEANGYVRERRITRLEAEGNYPVRKERKEDCKGLRKLMIRV